MQRFKATSVSRRRVAICGLRPFFLDESGDTLLGFREEISEVRIERASGTLPRVESGSIPISSGSDYKIIIVALEVSLLSQIDGGENTRSPQAPGMMACVPL